MIWVFVYGTLLPGEANAQLAAPYTRSRQPGAVSGRLYDAGAYPGLVPASAEEGVRVEGEWLELEEAALPVLDRLEDYRGPGQDNDYERVWISDVNGGRSGWAYVWSDGRGLPPIPSGLWRAHRRQREF